MTIDTENLLDSILESLSRIEYIRPEDIPDIDLYMDQVTTFMDGRLRTTTRNPGDDKVLTKTMINNYAKNDLLPPPMRKKYSKEHVLVLIFIYYFKGVMSINDIQILLKPITDKYFGEKERFDLEAVYQEVFGMEEEEVELLKEDVRRNYLKAQQTFQEAPQEDRDFLQKFSFICLLSFDVYVKKLMIEKMVDDLAGHKIVPDKKDKKEKKNDLCDGYAYPYHSQRARVQYAAGKHRRGQGEGAYVSGTERTRTGRGGRSRSHIFSKLQDHSQTVWPAAALLRDRGQYNGL